MEYICPDCGSTQVYVKPVHRRYDIRCSKCDKLITSTTYQKAKELYDVLKNKDLPDNLTLKKIRKKNNVTRISCLKCGCLLYCDLYKKAEGQYDLVEAIYCPRCGRKFV